MSECLTAAVIEAMCYGRVRLLPCRPDTKRPPMKGWPKKGTNDLTELEALFRRYPDSILTALTGGPSGVWMLDVDDRNGGKASLAELEKRIGPLPRSCHYRTPGGERFVFKWPEGCVIRQSSGKLAPGLDVKGGTDTRCTGHAIIPPSIRSDGGKYVWSKGSDTHFGDPPDAPLDLLFEAMFTGTRREKLNAAGIKCAGDLGALQPAQWEHHFVEMTRPKRPDGAPIPLEEGRGGRLQVYVRAAIERECAVLAETGEGGRDQALYESPSGNILNRWSRL